MWIPGIFRAMPTSSPCGLTPLRFPLPGWWPASMAGRNPSRPAKDLPLPSLVTNRRCCKICKGRSTSCIEAEVSWAISSGMAMKRSARKTIYLILSLLPLCTFSQAAEDATSKLDRVLSRDIRLKAEPLHPPPAPRDVASTLFLIFFSVVHPECPHGPCPQVETPEQMIARFRAGAEAGKSLFQWLLAAYLMTGESVPRDFDQGLYWLEKAAASGDGPAVQDLTRLYEAGVAMPNSPDNIVGYYEASSRPDLLPQVLTNFGHLYEFGDRLPRDFERAK